jgi:hydrogenase nickel incorporation protein HypA/HybF
MHEFALACSIVRIAERCAEQHGARRVTGVNCRVGVLRQVVPELLTRAFEAATTGTRLAEARLDVEAEPVQVRCAACGFEGVEDRWVIACSQCGSTQLHTSGGTELLVTAITVDDEDGES